MDVANGKERLVDSALPSKIVLVLATWSNGDRAAVVCFNTRQSLYDALDEVTDPVFVRELLISSPFETTLKDLRTRLVLPKVLDEDSEYHTKHVFWNTDNSTCNTRASIFFHG